MSERGHFELQFALPNQVAKVMLVHHGPRLGALRKQNSVEMVELVLEHNSWITS